MSAPLDVTPVEAAPPPVPELDVPALRADFPILAETVNGAPLVYLDSAATSQKPRVVLDAERRFLEHANAAVHRGAHTLAAEATELFEDARITVAGFVGARDDELVWTAGATAALNLVAYSIGNASAGRGGEAAKRYALAEGDEIVVTAAEHHANLIPWQELAARTGAVLRHIPVRDDGTLDLDAAASLIGERTRIVALTHVSNVLGIVNPVAELAALAHDAGAVVVLDACQSAPHLPLDLPALGVDLAAFSGHKLLGPYGVGCLYGRAEVLDALPPFLTGGSMVTTVTLDDAAFLPAPQKFEAGTQPVSQAIGLAAAVRYLDGLGMDAVHRREQVVERRMRDGLREIPGIRLLGDPREPSPATPRDPSPDTPRGLSPATPRGLSPDTPRGLSLSKPATPRDPSPDTPRGLSLSKPERVALVSFDVDGVHAHDVGQFLDDRGIAVRVGHHCAQPLHRRFGLAASVRASASVFTTDAEIDLFLDAVSGVRAFFGAAS